jgi:hypothetical protein
MYGEPVPFNQNIVQYMVKTNQPEFEIMMNILSMAKDQSIRSLIQNFDDFKNLFNI